MEERSKVISVFIVDDHKLIIGGLKALLQDCEDIQIVGHAVNGRECLDFFMTNSADVVLMDISLPDMSGITLCAELLKLQPQVRVLGLSSYNQPSYIRDLLKSGARGYLIKNTEFEEIKEAIYQVAKGNMFIGKEASDFLYSSDTVQPEDIPAITRRESEILRLLADGFTAPQIAEKLSLSHLTVETHRRNVMTKLKAKNVASLIKIAIDKKLV